MKQLYNRLSELGIEKNLRFSSQELLQNGVIALDGVQRKLLVISGSAKENYDETLIDLNELKSCSLKKEYGGIKAGELKKTKLVQLLNKVSLHFEFRDNKEPIEVSFYDHSDNYSSQASEMELKAKHWGIILYKMLRN